MQRTPEPELMLEREQAQAYAEANFEQPHQHFIELLAARLGPLGTSGLAVDLGCGPGDITLRVARLLPQWTLLGIDASPAMLELARARFARAGEARIETCLLHLPSPPPTSVAVHLLYSNSLLHHLEQPDSLWNTITSWGASTTKVFVMDLARPATRTEAARLVDLYATGEPEVLQTDFYNSLLAAYTEDEVTAQLLKARLDLKVETVSDRHWIAHGSLKSC